MLLDAVAFAQLPPAEMSYSRVLLKEVVHHIPPADVPALYAGLAAQLAPGGVAVTITRPQEVGYPLFARAREVGGWAGGRGDWAGCCDQACLQQRRLPPRCCPPAQLSAGRPGTCSLTGLPALQIWREHQPHYTLFTSAMQAAGLQVEVRRSPAGTGTTLLPQDTAACRWRPTGRPLTCGSLLLLPSHSLLPLCCRCCRYLSCHSCCRCTATTTEPSCPRAPG